MPQQFTRVKPGGLITAALINQMEVAIEQLSGAQIAGPVSIPNLFGLTLGNAVAILNVPSTQLTVGNVLDSLGNTIDSSQPDSQRLLVLNQMPVAGTNVFAGSSVNLVVAPKPGSSPPPPRLPSITGFNPTQVHVRALLEIDGLNFDPLPSNNNVTFAGVAAVAPSSASNPAKLIVVVP